MKLAVFLCLVAATLAAPPVASGREAQVLKSVYDNAGDGNYAVEYAQDDGTSFQAKGDFNPGTGKDGEGAFVAVKGTFEWVGPDGVTYTGNYVADQNGYHPHYTQGPNGVIPEEIIKYFSTK